MRVLVFAVVGQALLFGALILFVANGFPGFARPDGPTGTTRAQAATGSALPA
ncbi:MAG: hypothetical protein JWO90_241, partial [Solirubrobacterales bacterium]|nr:hypothetical protein [Solirubrobacterales bacterium]